MNKIGLGCVAEFVGTFALVFFGAGSIILTYMSTGSANLVTIAAAHGFALIVFVTAAQYISGGQFNPAVSLAVFLAGKQSAKQAAAFTLAQLFAAACAAGMLVLLLGKRFADNDAVMLGATIGSLTKAGDTWAVFGLEAFMTFALVFVVLACLVDDRAQKLGGFPVGLVVMMCIFFAGPLTGASMNPARSFGPALYGHWSMFGVYVLAHIVGASAAALFWRIVYSQQPLPAFRSSASS